MRLALSLLRTIHAWAGAALSAILVVLGLSGSLLVFRASLIRAALPQARLAAETSPEAIGAALEEIERTHGAHLDHVILADDRLGVHRLFLHGNARAYADQSGGTLVQWEGPARIEDWLYELHHFLLAGENGMRLAGFAGLCACLLALTGLAVWVPTWRATRLRLWPRGRRRGEFLSVHRNIGVLFAVPVIGFCLTGGAMIFNQSTQKMLADIFPGPEPEEFFPPARAGDVDWPAALSVAKAAFPQAELRAIVWPRFEGDRAEVRMRQPQEWTPEGRTRVLINPETSELNGVIDAQALGRGRRIEAGLLPLHGAFVGGWAMDLLALASGLALSALGVFGLIAFLVKPRGRKVAARRTRA